MARQLPPDEEWLLDEIFPVKVLPELVVVSPVTVPKEAPAEQVNRD